LVNKHEVRSRIEEIGIIPAVRVSSLEDALFAAEALSRGGIRIVEAIVAAPNAAQVISHLVRSAPEVIVGAGGIPDVETAHRCLSNGATFITSDGFDPAVVTFALQHGAVMIPGTFTPSEVINAWRIGPDFIKIVPCAPMGGDGYVRSLKAMFPNVPLIAAGGVNQQNASSFILAGAVALGIGAALIPMEAIRLRQPDRIAELARRFAGFVSSARGRFPVG
jgi:2-dehydro-3-deoxyphosphogluconate aldolase/(4S)-4-hydroxy-2-oxoglutarate aldolase